MRRPGASGGPKRLTTRPERSAAMTRTPPRTTKSVPSTSTAAATNNEECSVRIVNIEGSSMAGKQLQRRCQRRKWRDGALEAAAIVCTNLQWSAGFVLDYV